MLQILDKSGTSKMISAGEIRIIKNDLDTAWTVLGSCISVIFHVPKKISLICHAQMPAPAKMEHNCFDSCPVLCPNNVPLNKDFKYVTCSVEFMVKELVKLRINLKNIHTSVLGGATAFYGLENPNSIGIQNLIAVKSMLSKYNIRINREYTGGATGITAWYYPDKNRLLINKHKEEGKFELFDSKAF